MGPSFHVGLNNSVRDEFGETLTGVIPAADGLGVGATLGEVVQILRVTDSIYPPNRSGTPDARNPVVFQGRVTVWSQPRERQGSSAY